MIAPPPRRLGARFGVVGAFAKRVVERLIRFYTVQQDEVNGNVERRLRDLEAAPAERRGDDLDLRAQYGALSARLTYLQREIAALRSIAGEPPSGDDDARGGQPEAGGGARA